MTLNPIGKNMNVLTAKNGTRVLFSYKTPVAAYVVTDTGAEFIRTDKKWSNTTSRHITRWLDGRAATEVPQSKLDALAIGL